MKAGNLLDLEKQEHPAPKALVTPTGETYGMMAPTITKDNFILVDSKGQGETTTVMSLNNASLTRCGVCS